MDINHQNLIKNSVLKTIQFDVLTKTVTFSSVLYSLRMAEQDEINTSGEDHTGSQILTVHKKIDFLFLVSYGQNQAKSKFH